MVNKAKVFILANSTDLKGKKRFFSSEKSTSGQKRQLTPPDVSGGRQELTKTASHNDSSLPKTLWLRNKVMSAMICTKVISAKIKQIRKKQGQQFEPERQPRHTVPKEDTEEVE